jgi:hypothetical protein
MNPHTRVTRREMSSGAGVIQMNMRKEQIHDLSWMHAAKLKLTDKFGPSGRRAGFNQSETSWTFYKKNIGGARQI